MLRLLVQHRGKVVTHRQILRELWGPNSGENTHYLRVQMTHLRKKLDADPANLRHLRTEAGIGYRLVESGQSGPCFGVGTFNWATGLDAGYRLT